MLKGVENVEVSVFITTGELVKAVDIVEKLVLVRVTVNDEEVWVVMIVTIELVGV